MRTAGSHLQGWGRSDGALGSDGSHPHAWPRRLLAGWGVELAVLGIVGLALPLALATHYGTLGSPSADDWAYDLAVFHLAHTGRLFLYHWVTIDFVGQAFLALPLVLALGAHIAVLNTWTCCVGLMGLLALCHLGRSLGLPRAVALAASAFVALTPVWLRFSVSFMTDVPALAFAFLALAVVAADRRTDRYVTLAATSALALGFVAVSIRETTCWVLVAVVLGRAWRLGRPSSRAVRRWAALAAAWAAAVGAFYAWRRTLPGEGYQPPPGLHLLELANLTANSWTWPLAGLLLLPALIYAGGADAVARLAASHPRRLVVAWLVVPGLPLAGHLLLVERTWGGGFAPSLGVLLGDLVLPFGNQGFDLSPLGAPGVATRWVLIGASAAFSAAALVAWAMIAALVVGARPPWGWTVAARDRVPGRASPGDPGIERGALGGPWLELLTGGAAA